MDQALALEALEAILERPVRSIKEFQRSNPDQGRPTTLQPQRVIDLTVGARFWIDYTCGRLSPNAAKRRAPPSTDPIYVDEDEFFDPQWNYDYTNINDGTTKFLRGGEVYKRPCGWMRFAVKVLDKYPDGNTWLGTGNDAWPVSYHGTSIEAAKAIIESWYQAGSGAAYGRGIYSTPNVGTAEHYSKTFKSKITNKTYKVALQNRINPKNRVQCPVPDYWLVPVPPGSSDNEERQIVEGSIRPYGLLLKQVG